MALYTNNPLVNGSVNNVKNANEADNRALFLTKFAGEVYIQREYKSEVSCKMHICTDTHEYQIPLLGKAKSLPVEQTERGEIVPETSFNQTDLKVALDKPYYTRVVINDLDKYMSHFWAQDTGTHQSRLAEDFAYLEDLKIFRTGLKGARSASRLDGDKDGIVIWDANGDTNGSVFEELVFTGITELKKNRKNPLEFKFYTTSEQVKLLFTSDSRFLQQEYSGTTGVDRHVIYSMFNVELKESQNFTDACVDNSADTSFDGRYAINCESTIGLFYHPRESVVGVRIPNMKVYLRDASNAPVTNLMLQDQTGYEFYQAGSCVELATADTTLL